MSVAKISSATSWKVKGRVTDEPAMPIKRGARRMQPYSIEVEWERSDASQWWVAAVEIRGALVGGYNPGRPTGHRWESPTYPEMERDAPGWAMTFIYDNTPTGDIQT